MNGTRFELDHRLHVLVKKEELDTVRVPGKVVIVLDILFATTTMTAALAAGATAVIPVDSEAAARAEAARRDPARTVLAGELHARTLPGFAEPTPLALVAHGVHDRTLVYSTTNGTVAMNACAGAEAVYCGALLNASALAAHILGRHPGRTVLVLCAGSGGNFNLEDFYGAGCFVERFVERLGANADCSDAARVAHAYFRATAPGTLLECRVGRMMRERGLEAEVRRACEFDSAPVVPRLDGGRLALVA